MRQLCEIIDDIKDNKQPTYEELRYSVLALSYLLHFDHQDLESVTKDTREFVLNIKKKNSEDRHWKAMKMCPKEFIGWGNDPENPEYQTYRAIGARLLEKITNKMRAEGNL